MEMRPRSQFLHRVTIYPLTEAFFEGTAKNQGILSSYMPLPPDPSSPPSPRAKPIGDE